MSDMAEDFNALKKHKQEKRASNREQSSRLLAQSGIPHESKNLGAHLVVTAGRAVIDFWPGTGLWIVRGRGVSQRGVQKLIHFAKRQMPRETP